MRLIPARAWVLIAFSAILQTLAFPLAGPLPIWRSAVCWICLVPFLTALFLPGRDGKPLNFTQSFLLGYSCGFLWYLANCYWIYQTMYLYGGLPKPVSAGILILFALYLGLYQALFAVLVRLMRSIHDRELLALSLTPFLWVAVELARARITGFPWDLLGYAQVDNFLLTRLAPLGGVMSMSFAIAAINAALASFFIIRRTRSSLLIPVGAILLLSILQLTGTNDRRAGAKRTNLRCGSDAGEY